MRGGPIGDMSNVLFHQCTCLGIIETRNEETTLHIHNHMLAEITRSTLTTGFDHPIEPSLSCGLRENLVNNIVRRQFTLDVCECNVAKGIDPQLNLRRRSRALDV